MRVRVFVNSDDNKAPWGINIMKKAKKPGSPKAFGVRLEDCQPALNHKVRPPVFTSTVIHSPTSV